MKDILLDYLWIKSNEDIDKFMDYLSYNTISKITITPIATISKIAHH
jgi:hypothetical protein